MLQGGLTGVLNLTPPPEALVRPEAAEGARRRCEMVADRLGLSGVAQIDAFMHAETGDIVVLEANVLPAMHASAPLLLQVGPRLRARLQSFFSVYPWLLDPAWSEGEGPACSWLLTTARQVGGSSF
jgi:hypothetical protein